MRSEKCSKGKWPRGQEDRNVVKLWRMTYDVMWCHNYWFVFRDVPWRNKNGPSVAERHGTQLGNIGGTIRDGTCVDSALCFEMLRLHRSNIDRWPLFDGGTFLSPRQWPNAPRQARPPQISTFSILSAQIFALHSHFVDQTTCACTYLQLVTVYLKQGHACWFCFLMPAGIQFTCSQDRAKQNSEKLTATLPDGAFRHTHLSIISPSNSEHSRWSTVCSPQLEDGAGWSACQWPAQPFHSSCRFWCLSWCLCIRVMSNCPKVFDRLSVIKVSVLCFFLVCSLFLWSVPVHMCEGCGARPLQDARLSDFRREAGNSKTTLVQRRFRVQPSLTLCAAISSGTEGKVFSHSLLPPKKTNNLWVEK